MNGRFVTAFSLLFLAACATPKATPPNFVRWSDSAAPAAPPAAAAEPTAPAPSFVRWSDFAAPAAPTASAAAAEPTALASLAPYRIGARDSYTVFKLGSFMPAGDIDNLDDGIAAEAVFGHKLLPFLSIEGAVGYITADGGAADLTAIPLFVNGRVSLSIAILEVYGGLGVGGMYVDYDFDDDFVLAGQAFLGASVGLGNLALGLEYKYLQTEDTKDNFSVEGGIASVFISLPF